MNWHVYIVECADGTLYTGITNNVEKRVQKHNTGKGAKYTRGRLPVTLRWSECCGDTKGTALVRELDIKSLSRNDKQFLIESRRAA
jgi:putative endonuclease